MARKAMHVLVELAGCSGTNACPCGALPHRSTKRPHHMPKESGVLMAVQVATKNQIPSCTPLHSCRAHGGLHPRGADALNPPSNLRRGFDRRACADLTGRRRPNDQSLMRLGPVPRLSVKLSAHETGPPAETGCGVPPQHRRNGLCHMD